MSFQILRAGRFSRDEILSQTWKWIVCLGYKTTNGEYQVEFVGRSIEGNVGPINFQHEVIKSHNINPSTLQQNSGNEQNAYNQQYSVIQQNASTNQQNDLLDILEEFKTWRDIFKWEVYCLNKLQLFFDLLSMYPPTLEYMRRLYSIFPEMTELSLSVAKIPLHEKIFPFTIIISKDVNKIYEWLQDILVNPLNVESVGEYRKITVFTDCIIMKNPELFYEEDQMLPLHIPRVLVLDCLSKIKVRKYTKVYKFDK